MNKKIPLKSLIFLNSANKILQKKTSKLMEKINNFHKEGGTTYRENIHYGLEPLMLVAVY